MENFYKNLNVWNEGVMVGMHRTIIEDCTEKNSIIFFIINQKVVTLQCFSGRSAVGSVPRSGRGGRWFESSHPDKK